MTATESTAAACCNGEQGDSDDAGASIGGLANDEDIAVLCKALAHPARVAILRRLLAVDDCVFGTLADLVPLAPSTVAQHLAKLRAAGLIRQWDEGARSCYCIDRQRLSKLRALLDDL